MEKETVVEGSSNVLEWYFYQDSNHDGKEEPIDWISPYGYNTKKMEIYIGDVTISSDDTDQPIRYFSDGKVEIRLGDIGGIFNNRTNTVTMKAFKEGDVLGEIFVHSRIPSSSAKITLISS